MCKKLTTTEFISKARLVHGDKYDYSQTEYVNNRTQVLIICPTHGKFWQNPKSHIQGHGCSKCYLCSKHKYGVATCDIPNSSNEDYYNTWRSLLERALSKIYKKKYPTYATCSICNEWLTLSNFKKWFENPKNGYQEGYHLDKDILIKGNKEYSPSACCFVPQEINLLFGLKRKTNNLPLGVMAKHDKYKAQIHINGKKLILGTYNTPEEAFCAYKNAKERHIKETAERYFKEGKITEKVYNALMKYEVEITD